MDEDWKWLFNWFSRGIGEHTIKYYDNWYASSTFVVLIIFLISFVVIWIPEKLFRWGGWCWRMKRWGARRGKFARRFCRFNYWFWYVFELLFGLFLILLITMMIVIAIIFGKLPFYVGIFVLFLFLSFAFLHTLRIRDVQGKQKKNVGDKINDIENELEDISKSSRTTVDDPEVQDRWICCKDMFHNCIYYPKAVVCGLKKCAILFIFAVALIAIISIAISLLTCNICIMKNPYDANTAFVRLVSGKLCEWGAICYTYMTVPNDMSTSMIINFHVYSSKPTSSYVIYGLQPFDTKTASNLQAIPQTTVVPGTCVSMHYEEERYQCWSDLVGLTPDTTYYVSSVAMYDKPVVSQLQFKFRTAPIGQNTTTTFAIGGDFSMDESGTRMAKQIIEDTNPHFVAIVGDIAHAYGNAFCYRRWDKFFKQWQNTMKTKDGYSIPLLTAIGENEADGFKRPTSDDPFYLYYFPHELGLQNIKPTSRKTNHAHLISDHTLLLMLDSYVHQSPVESAAWIGDQLQMPNITNTIAAYHLAMYPSRDIDSPLLELINAMKRNWIPQFDKYHLKVAFEHHFYGFKETYPLVAGAKSNSGTVYLGDGGFGVDIKPGVKSSPLLKDVQAIPHLFVVEATEEGMKVTAKSYSDTDGFLTTYREYNF